MIFSVLGAGLLLGGVMALFTTVLLM